ncbi:competence protein ComG [Salipaludibacillus keqinensis]|uniref:ComG operon protein 3 n=1 Tax=Salipaludibacillus keqinensis TaxID=2045207 RepID=A0A323TJZ1_9BACI|nr:competence type IV pilus major pilin ComGC [Salipaludibacillus keqinensis]PYZ95311.1 competence protein ComG [Salipaludibacillus keqinensis]
MKKIIRSSKGFTLIEMMIVLVIISILLLIVVPNLTKNQELASDKGCEATIELIKTQVVAYQIEHNKLPSSISELEGDYVQSTTCPDGSKLILAGSEVKKAD